MDVVRVREIEARLLRTIVEQRTPLDGPGDVPAHMRHFERRIDGAIEAAGRRAESSRDRAADPPHCRASSAASRGRYRESASFDQHFLASGAESTQTPSAAPYRHRTRRSRHDQLPRRGGLPRATGDRPSRRSCSACSGSSSGSRFGSRRSQSWRIGRSLLRSRPAARNETQQSAWGKDQAALVPRAVAWFSRNHAYSAAMPSQKLDPMPPPERVEPGHIQKFPGRTIWLVESNTSLAPG